MDDEIILSHNLSIIILSIYYRKKMYLQSTQKLKNEMTIYIVDAK